jgi:hypothetical protein
MSCRWCGKKFEPAAVPDKIKTPGTVYTKDGEAISLHAYPVGCFYCSDACANEHARQFALAWAGFTDGIRQDVIQEAKKLMPLRETNNGGNKMKVYEEVSRYAEKVVVMLYNTKLLTTDAVATAFEALVLNNKVFELLVHEVKPEQVVDAITYIAKYPASHPAEGTKFTVTPSSRFVVKLLHSEQLERYVLGRVRF